MANVRASGMDLAYFMADGTLSLVWIAGRRAAH